MKRFKDYDPIDRLFLVVCTSAVAVLVSAAVWAVVAIWSRIFGGGA